MSKTPEKRRPRADAQRNRERIVEAANTAFRQRGLDVSVAEIARLAGVGSGTLFRNFPTKDDLIRAILEQHLKAWIAELQAGIDRDDPKEAFEEFFDDAVAFNMNDRALLEALGSGLLDQGTLAVYKENGYAAIEPLVDRAKQAGCVRKELSHRDVLSLALGTAEAANAIAREGFADAETARARYVAVTLAGMRP